MTKKKRTRLNTADQPLSRSLTDAFISDLKVVLMDDPGLEARYLLDGFLTKFTELDASSAKVRQSRAIEKWLSTETTNASTNKRLRGYIASEHVDILPGIPACRFTKKVREIVAQIVPFTPSLDIAYGGFSGGATTSSRRAQGHPALKFLDKADVTRPALPIFREMIRGTRWADHFGDSGLEPRFVSGNILFTVPKNAEIDRVACKEPDLNIFLQKALGNQIRRCLKRVGIDLNDQSRNQEFARIGAADGSLLTLDLSAASDSVTYELVKGLMPDNWFFYLDAFRSPNTLVEGENHVNEMFSSMGNGFTFELESLLFYAITRATAYFAGVKGSISVYGDDIIAPVEIGNDLVSALAFYGFKSNLDKSFLEGPFRESCGAHWHGEVNVTPFYIRRPFLRVSDLILTLNQLASWASRVLGVVDPRYEDIHAKYREYVPEDLWGGDDLTSRSSLVTGHSARKELVWPVETIQHSHVGGLLYWLFTALPRTHDGFVNLLCDKQDPLESAGSRVLGFARVRRRRSVDRLDVPLFLKIYEERDIKVKAAPA